MAVAVLAEPSEAVVQRAIYNQNLGGSLKKSTSFSVPAGTHWAAVGLILADAATPEAVETTLVPAIAALSEVTSVHGDQVYGQIPVSVAEAGFEFVVTVASQVVAKIGGTDYFDQVVRATETITPPLGKKWVIVLCRLPAALTSAGITALESSLQGINGVTTAEHLIDGTISTRAAENATLHIGVHLRLEPIEE